MGCYFLLSRVIHLKNDATPLMLCWWRPLIRPTASGMRHELATHVRWHFLVPPHMAELPAMWGALSPALVAGGVAVARAVLDEVDVSAATCTKKPAKTHRTLRPTTIYIRTTAS